MKCPNCEHEVSRKRKICKYCGFELCSDIEYVKGKTENFIDERDFISATSFIDEGLGYNPDNPDLLYLKSVISRYLWDHDKEYEYLKKALNINPNHGKSLYHISIFLFNKNEYEKSLEYINRLLNLDPTKKAYELKIMTLYNLCKYNLALNTIEDTLKIFPNDTTILKIKESIEDNEIIKDLNFEKISLLKLSSKDNDKTDTKNHSADLNNYSNPNELYELITPDLPNSEFEELNLNTNIEESDFYDINFKDLDILDSELKIDNTKENDENLSGDANLFLKKLNKLVFNNNLNKKSFTKLLYESFNNQWIAGDSIKFLKVLGEYKTGKSLKHSDLNFLNSLKYLEFFNYEDVFNSLINLLTEEIENLIIYLVNMGEYEFDTLCFLLDLNASKNGDIKSDSFDFNEELEEYSGFNFNTFNIDKID